jgi:hypothetical protein
VCEDLTIFSFDLLVPNRPVAKLTSQLDTEVGMNLGTVEQHRIESILLQLQGFYWCAGENICGAQLTGQQCTLTKSIARDELRKRVLLSVLLFENHSHLSREEEVESFGCFTLVQDDVALVMLYKAEVLAQSFKTLVVDTIEDLDCA